MMTIILYIVIGIIVLVLASALLPYILVGGIGYAIYRYWNNISGWFGGVKHWNWKMIGLIFAGIVLLGLIIQWFEKSKYSKIITFIDEMGMCEVAEIIQNVGMSNVEISKGLEVFMRYGDITKIDIQNPETGENITCYRSKYGMGKNLEVSREISLD